MRLFTRVLEMDRFDFYMCVAGVCALIIMSIFELKNEMYIEENELHNALLMIDTRLTEHLLMLGR